MEEEQVITIKIRCHQPLAGEDAIPVLNEIQAFVFDRLPNPTTVSIHSKGLGVPEVLGSILPGSFNFSFSYAGGSYQVQGFTAKAEQDSKIHLALGTVKQILSQQSPEEAWAGDDGPPSFPWDHDVEPGKGSARYLPFKNPK